MNSSRPMAVVLLSGGLDSSTCLAIACARFACHALTVRYGQRNAPELDSARRVAQSLGAVEHRVVDLPLNLFGGSSLTDLEHMTVPISPDGVTPSPAPADGIPSTYVPARNSVFLTLGAAWADALGSSHLFIGVNRVDYSGYPDCRPDFIQAMQHALQLGTRRRDLQIHTPLMDLSKAEIIARGVELGLDYGLTWSCYDPRKGRACGVCDSCIHRKKGFREAGVPDPTPYVS